MMARICLASPKGGMLQSRPVPLYEVLAAARQGSRIKAKRGILFAVNQLLQGAQWLDRL
jgi:hypothetical protein